MQQEMELSSSKDIGQGEAPEVCNRSGVDVVVEDARKSLGKETLLEEVIEKRNVYQAI